MKDLKYEVEILSDGLGAGDNASNIMSEKAGHRLGFLTNASENREVFNCPDTPTLCVLDPQPFG